MVCLLQLVVQCAAAQYGNCRKWLRYYLDFCKKCDYAYADPKSLGLFIGKLKGKKQSEQQQVEAKIPIELYYSGIQKPGLPPQQVCEVQQNYGQEQELCAWDIAIEALKNEIKVRHYSVKTMKAYSLWAEKLRYFTKEKNP